LVRRAETGYCEVLEQEWEQEKWEINIMCKFLLLMIRMKDGGLTSTNNYLKSSQKEKK
jgi:hypothetical protein